MKAVLWFAAIAAAAGGIYLYQNQECTVGVAGAVASVTIHGPSAGQACDAFMKRSTAATYRASAGSTIPVVCEYPVGALRYTVRDQGALVLYGSQICASIASR